MKSARTVKAAGLLALMIIFSFSGPRAETGPFPIPEIIAPNVAFWTKVYGTYTTNQGIVHDNLDLNIIYDVIDLLPYNAPGATKINRQRMKNGNQKYEQILRRLATNPDCDDADCRRVAALFPEPRAAHQFRQAVDRVRCQIGQMDRFREGLIRSGAYIDQIRTIFKSYNLPEDLAYLPHVESSFNPNAYSKAGAAGMWQFTHSTGKRFMQVGYTVDERRDPISATHAAAQLLRENYAELGDWPLAITAYNHGTSGMQRAKQLHGDYAQVFQSYQSRSFKFASRNFYSEFLAARQVAANHTEYFGELALDTPVPYRTHVMDGYVSFAKLSQHFGVAPEVLKRLNPALRQPVVRGQKHVPKGYALRLPLASENSETLVAQAIPQTLYQKEQKPTRFYTVKRGDTASKIARAHGVEVDELILANNLDRRATILPRQTLQIPVRGEKPVEPEIPLLAANAPSTKADAMEINTAVSATTPPAAAAASPAGETQAPLVNTKPPAVSSAPPSGPQAPEGQTKPQVVLAAALDADTKEPSVEKLSPVLEPPAPATKPTSPATEPAEPIIQAAAEEPVHAQPSNENEPKADETATAAAQAPTGAAVEPVLAAASDQRAESMNPPAPIEKSEVVSAPPVLAQADHAPVARAAAREDENPGPAADETPLAQYPRPMLASVIPVAPGVAEKEPLTLEALRQQVSNDQIVAADVGFERVMKIKGQPVGVIQVEIEETLGHYAEWADVRTQQIRNLNGLSFNSVIHLHQKIKIPLHRVTAEAFEQNRYEFHKRLQEDFFAVYRIGDLQDYQVREGDNYWTLSQSKFEIPMWLLKHCNPETDLADLQINQKLIIPIVEKASQDDASPADEQGTEAMPANQEESSRPSEGEV